MDFPEDGMEKVREMRDRKFSTWDFIYGHSHEADLTKKAKLPCGTVEAAIRIDRGIIQGLTFSGDFLFDRPIEELASSLIGCRFDRLALADRLEQIDVDSYFKGVTKDDIIRGLF